MYLREIFQAKASRGHILKGDLTEGFLRLWGGGGGGVFLGGSHWGGVGGGGGAVGILREAPTWRGLFSEFYGNIKL